MERWLKKTANILTNNNMNTKYSNDYFENRAKTKEAKKTLGGRVKYYGWQAIQIIVILYLVLVVGVDALLLELRH